MRSPEHRKPHSNRTAQHFHDDLSRYLNPGAFTILSSEDEPPPDPPMAPQPYRLTPSSKRHKNTSFAILAEPGNSRPGSRSPSPSGRVSPFRGRGFNPTGSRHVSPAPSPPPPNDVAFTTLSTARSKIPKLSRRDSASIFGERVDNYQTSPNKRKLNSNLSQSLTNISTSKSNRPPPSPRRAQGHHNSSAFQRLSPIVGSSPEPSQSQSSPTKSRSQPQSRFSSPSRIMQKPPPGRNSRTDSRTPSRNISREPSPNKVPTSPTRIPVKRNYRNIQAKVNSFNRVKPKVPPKPNVTSEDSDTSDTYRGSSYRSKIERKESVRKLRNNSKSNLISQQGGNTTYRSNKNNNNTNANNQLNNSNPDISNNNNLEKTDKNGNSKLKKNASKQNLLSESTSKKNNTNSNKTEGNGKNDKNSSYSGNNINNNKNNSGTDNDNNKVSENPVKLADLLQPSTTAVVSSTTTTVTQPLKIEAKLENSSESKLEPTTRIESKVIAPIVDGRVLSATSVSNAMNKMNDTVLDTQTLMKDHGLSKLSPAASTIIAMSGQETHKTNPALDTKNATTALPSVESAGSRMNEMKNSNHNNHVTSTGIISAKVLEQHVQNNMSKLIHPDNNVMGNSVQKSVNDRIKESRTLIAGDVKPIKITVKERPMDVEVQSGNIRFDAANGINERPGLPPAQPTTNDQPNEQQNAPKPNRCTRIFTACKNKMACQCCSGQKEQKKMIDNEEVKPGCFNCRKKKPEVTINIEDDEPKPTFCDRLKCCNKNKISDGCFSKKRKDSWTTRQDSILSSEPPEQKSRCNRFFSTLFCIDRCRKQKKPVEDTTSRRASMMSKKKSLTPSVPHEDNTPKLDTSLVEHNSAMKGAIPVLPICLAWFCLIMNCIAPGTGTVFSGIFCLCLGIPRFSQKDGPKQRLGAFIIDLIIGIGQFFTVLFCLVGWGWSIWWGVIMLKIARKHHKIKSLRAEVEKQEQGSRQNINQNHNARDSERRS